MEQIGAGMTLWDALGEVEDHRGYQGRRYPLQSMLAITLAAMLAGRTSLAGVARWGRQLTRKGLEAFGIDRKKAPCHATYHNAFKGLDIVGLEESLSGWVRVSCGEEALGHVALDGKSLRGSASLDGPAVHLLAAYSETLKGVVKERTAPAETNAISAALKLLRGKVLKGAVMTGDAMFAQKEICEEILEGEGNYFFVVKENQPRLQEDIQSLFSEPFSPLSARLQR